ncbi:DUF3967 domain-containing protein [Metabacillus fastidiosus]|uniref:DUF3967 domain-containing protein n=1 Tax=Metabacillus fastidiosus TaxID=1458 RepID=UPI002E1CFDB8|nr:DUF3967 domain-containing protein [Metabacillus fastidiosus]
MSGTEKKEMPLTAKEVSQRLNVADSTLRKWCLSLEEHNYNFFRTDQNKRLFTVKDVTVLQHFKDLVQDKNMSMNNAAMIVTSRFQKGPFSDQTDVEQVIERESSVPVTRSNDELLERLVTYIEQQEENWKQQKQLNADLVAKIDEQQKYIEERMEQRDAILMQSLRETQETKKLIVAAAEEKREEDRKGLWQRLFGKSK